MKRNIIVIMVCLLLISFMGCGKKRDREAVPDYLTIDEVNTIDNQVVPEEEQEKSLYEAVVEKGKEEIVQEPVFEEYEFQIMALGDNLLHMGIVNTGRQEDGSYNFDFLFKGMEEYLDLAEMKVINQETILGGNELGFSGYPQFNSPTEVGDAIVKAGFNVVLQATNHSADKGINGLLHCVDYWKKQEDVLMVGIDDDSSFEYEIPIIEVEGIKVAVLNYTYSPNTEVISKSIRGHLNILCDWDTESGRIDFTKLHPKVIDDILKAEQEADFTIVFPHWGTEYATKPSEYQKSFAKLMTEAGADLIIGTHPHVLQPIEWIEGDNGLKSLCYYSLGNYVSTQKDPLNMLEGMAWVTVFVQEDGVSIKEDNTGILPLVCQYTGASPRLENVYALDRYSDELAAKHGIISYGGKAIDLTELNRWSEEILGEWILSSGDILLDQAVINE